MQVFGEYLKSLRGDKSLREVSDRSGISHSYLNSLEKGYDPRTKKGRKPSVDVIRKLANFYQVDYYELLDKAGYISSSDLPDESKKRFEHLKKQINVKNNTTKYKEPIDIGKLLRLESIHMKDIILSPLALYFNEMKLTDSGHKKLYAYLEAEYKRDNSKQQMVYDEELDLEDLVFDDTELEWQFNEEDQDFIPLISTLEDSAKEQLRTLIKFLYTMEDSQKDILLKIVDYLMDTNSEESRKILKMIEAYIDFDK